MKASNEESKLMSHLIERLEFFILLNELHSNLRAPFRQISKLPDDSFCQYSQPAFWLWPLLMKVWQGWSDLGATQRGWSSVIFKVSSNLSHSMITEEGDYVISRVATNANHCLEAPKHWGFPSTEPTGRLPRTASQDMGFQGIQQSKTTDLQPECSGSCCRHHHCHNS